MQIKAFHFSKQGASHIKNNNKPCQDNSDHFISNDFDIAVVCDGHGGNDYFRSELGSKFAVEVAIENIKEFMNGIRRNETLAEIDNNQKYKTYIEYEQFERKQDTVFRFLESKIISNWRDKVQEHFKKNPFTAEELKGISDKAKKRYQDIERIASAYGTTLIAVAINKRENFAFGIQIGDGKCVVLYQNSTFDQPIELDEKCFLNATTSMCDSDALNSFHHILFNEIPVAIFVGSDGIDDCFKSDKQLEQFYTTIAYSFGTSEFDDAKNELEGFLPKLSAKGSGDDVSIAALIDMDILPNTELVKSFDLEKEKERVEKARIDEAKKIEEMRIKAEKESEESRIRFEANQRNNAETNNTIISRIKKYVGLKEDVIYCPYCGAKYLPGANFCARCGVQIPIEKCTQSQETIILKDNDSIKEKFSEPKEAPNLSDNNSTQKIDTPDLSVTDTELSLSTTEDKSINETQESLENEKKDNLQ